MNEMASKPLSKFSRFFSVSIKGDLRIIAKIGIPSDKYQKDWKSRLRREKRYNFHKFSVRNSGASSGDVRKLRIWHNEKNSGVHRGLENNADVCQPVYDDRPVL